VAEPSKVRAGDRYLRGEDERITVVAVNASENKADCLVMGPGSRTPWHITADLPLPDAWVKTGSGPIGRDEKCLDCDVAEREEGLYFCADCTTAQATNWAGMTDEQIESRTRALRLLEKLNND
jgi:hypothetical protein